MNPQAGKSIWDVRAVRELFVLLCALALAYAAYRIRATLAPIGFAFLLSYAVEPPVRYLQERHRMPRGASAAISLLVFAAGITAF
jgi:predicted PurR-regulated permease PerM